MSWLFRFYWKNFMTLNIIFANLLKSYISMNKTDKKFYSFILWTPIEAMKKKC